MKTIADRIRRYQALEEMFLRTEGADASGLAEQAQIRAWLDAAGCSSAWLQAQRQAEEKIAEEQESEVLSLAKSICYPTIF